MKQRIFIAIHYLEIGGAERSLLGLLNALDVALYDIDLFIYSHQGEFMRMIPKKIRLLPEIPQYAALERPAQGDSQKWALENCFCTVKGEVVVLEIYEAFQANRRFCYFPICGGLYDWVATLFISVWGV